VLAPGKYVFELADSDSDRNIVQIYSKDSDGNETLVATILAIPDYTSNTPDKTIIHFDERHSGIPEAIHSWYYPGDNTGWEFIYPKGLTPEAAMNTTPNPGPAVTATAPSVTPETQVHQVAQNEPAPKVAVAREEILVAQNEAPAQPPVQGTEIQTGAAQVLPQTAGNSYLELLTGFAMLGVGLAALVASRIKALS
jgi:hypothetical protein